MNHNRIIDASVIGREFDFQTARSGGPGGQNVNKVNSKVIIKWNVAESMLITDEEKNILLNKLSTKLTSDHVLIVMSQEKRSQLENKEAAIAKLERILVKAFEQKKKRKPTKPSKASVKKRIESKKQHSEKKQWRQKSGY